MCSKYILTATSPKRDHIFCALLIVVITEAMRLFIILIIESPIVFAINIVAGIIIEILSRNNLLMVMFWHVMNGCVKRCG